MLERVKSARLEQGFVTLSRERAEQPGPKKSLLLYSIEVASAATVWQVRSIETSG